MRTQRGISFDHAERELSNAGWGTKYARWRKPPIQCELVERSAPILISTQHDTMAAPFTHRLRLRLCLSGTAAWMGIVVDMWTYLEFPGSLQIPKYQEISTRRSRTNLTIAAMIIISTTIIPASGQPASEDQRPRLQWAYVDLAPLPAPQSAIL